MCPPSPTCRRSWRPTRSTASSGIWAGRNGLVYLAQNLAMGWPEVLKLLAPAHTDRPDARDRFEREVRSAGRLHHPNVVTAYATLELGKLLVLAMEYVDGKDLARVVENRGRLPVRAACSYASQAALDLRHAHEKGLVHRDIKAAADTRRPRRHAPGGGQPVRGRGQRGGDDHPCRRVRRGPRRLPGPRGRDGQIRTVSPGPAEWPRLGVVGPPKFRGDHADAFGKYLKYRLWVSHADEGNPAEQWYVGFRSKDVIMAVRGDKLGRPQPGTWNQYKIRLDASGWWHKLEQQANGGWAGGPTNDDELRQALADIRALWIQGEFSEAHDEGQLDDVEFGADR